MLTPDEIQKMIQTARPNADVKILDPMNDGVHLSAMIVSADFEDKNRISRHRMVYAALGDAFSGPLHALQMSTLTPSEAKAAATQ
jgi:stress-induced morphogen